MVGPHGSGKTSLVRTFKTQEYDEFTTATIGAEYTNLHIDDRCSVNIWDTAGSEKYSTIMPLYYRNSDVAILVFDTSDPSSILSVDTWMQIITTYTENIILVGNKMDKQEQINTDILLNDLKKKYSYIQLSATNLESVNHLFVDCMFDNLTSITEHTMGTNDTEVDQTILLSGFAIPKTSKYKCVSNGC